MRAKLLSAAFAALSLGGCATPPLLMQRSATITDQALEFNEAAALNDRQLILLNVLRARDWESLSFSRLSMFQNSSTRELRAGLNSSIGEGAGNDTLSPSLSVAGSHAPRFDLPVLTSQEFQRAIHSPVDLQLYQTFIEQGWQPGLIHMLLIERMTLSCATIQSLRLRLAPDGEAMRREARDVQDEYGRVLQHCGLGQGQTFSGNAPAVTLYNYPTDWPAHLQFRRWLRILMVGGQDHLRICAYAKNTAVGGPLDAEALRDLEGVAAIESVANHAISPIEPAAPTDPPRWRIQRRSVERGFALGCPGGASAPNPDVRIPSVQVRSVEGVIYFLGEITRVREHYVNRAPQRRTAAQETRIADEDALPRDFGFPAIEIAADASGMWRERLAPESERANSLFLITHGRGAGGVTVRHHGEDYTIPYQALTCGSLQCGDLGPDRSQQVLEFVLQLLNMSQNRADLPVTPTVNVAP